MKLLSKRSRGPALLLLVTWLGLGGCASEVNLAAVPEAVAGCEEPTEAELNPEATMLPGRDCMACHTKDGQASRRVWTAAGTVFDSPTAKCNTQGVEGVKVQITDSLGKVLITLFTNRAGNFFTSEPLNFSSIKVRISKDGKEQLMEESMSSADCALCHRPGGQAPGRIYLN